MEDFLFYFVFVAIAFVSWIYRKFQEATAERQRLKAEAEMKRRGLSPQQIKRELELELEGESAPELTSPQETIRRLYEALGGETVTAPEPQERDSPPPIPRGAAEKRNVTSPPLERPPAHLREVRREKLSKAEQEALTRVQGGALGGRANRRRRKGGFSGPLDPVAMIRDPEAQRAAIVLKEILDKPVSMRA